MSVLTAPNFYPADHGVVSPHRGLIYIAGPMSGLPNYNFTAFFEAERRLQQQRWNTVNPAQHDIDEGWVNVVYDSLGGILSADKPEEGAFDWTTALDWDLRAIERCDALYLLPGWSRSRGASKEYRFAMERGIEILGARNEAAAPTTDQPLVGLVGYARCGKDTFAAALGYRRLAFADPLKALAVYLNPLTSDSGGGLLPLESLVEQVGWDKAKEMAVNEPWGTRPLLQRLGVGVREILGADTWVEAAFAKFDPTQPTVFTDVRFPNEVAAIRDRGGVIVRLTRQSLNPPNNHVSEELVRTVEPDYDITAPWSGVTVLQDEAKRLDETLRGGR